MSGAESMNTEDLDIDPEAPTQRMLPHPAESEQPTMPSAIVPEILVRPPGSRRYYPLRMAAERLHIRVDALRARCQRKAKRTGDTVVADLGGGFLAVKFGCTWLVSLPPL